MTNVDLCDCTNVKICTIQVDSDFSLGMPELIVVFGKYFIRHQSTVRYCESKYTFHIPIGGR